MKKSNVKNASSKQFPKVKFGKWPEKPEPLTSWEKSILARGFTFSDDQIQEFLNENYIEIDRHRLYFDWNGELVSADGPVVYGYLVNHEAEGRRSIKGYFLVYDNRVYQCLNLIEANKICGLIQKEYEGQMHEIFEVKEASRRLHILKSGLSGANITAKYPTGKVSELIEI